MITGIWCVHTFVKIEGQINLRERMQLLATYITESVRPLKRNASGVHVTL